MSKKKILIVDDEKDIVETIKVRLEGNNYEVIAAYDGEEGLEKARTVNPDLIILDVMMPKVGGFRVCDDLKLDPKYKKIPIIILTAKTQEKDEEFGHEVGANAYITKPFESDELLAKIEELLK